MKYISTRGQSKPLSFSEILLGGLAPDVAPRILISAFSFLSTYSKRLPSNCIAISLNASVGPFESERIYKLSLTFKIGVMSSAFCCGLENAYTSFIYV